MPTVLAATDREGLFAFSDESRRHELEGRSVLGITPDGGDGALAIVDRRSLRRRSPSGDWTTIATIDAELACALALGDTVYVGTTDGPRVLCVSRDGEYEWLKGLDEVPGRDTWYAGTAVINGQLVGPPLGVRTLAATPDGAVLLANVHVGGISRSTDGGATWHPTIDIETDVHEVRAHPTRQNLVIAASAAGLCVSEDAGATWTTERDGLHAAYCSAVAFSGEALLVSAAQDHFDEKGAVYRRSISGEERLELVGNGLPTWLGGIADTGCIASAGSTLAIADKSGSLYLSTDAGGSWSVLAEGLPRISSVLIV